MDLSKISDAQAEAGVIATLIYNPKYILYSDALKAKYFWHTENGCLYWAIGELVKSGIENIDAYNLTAILNSNVAVKNRISSAGITDIQGFVANAQFVARNTLQEYKLLVNTVISLSFKRSMIKQCGEIIKYCTNPEIGLDELNKKTNDAIDSVLESYLIADEIQMFAEKVPSLRKQLTNGVAFTIPSCFQCFDDYFYYLPGELVVVKARMKDGKSIFLMNEVMDKVRNKVPTLFLSTEVSDKLTYARIVSYLTGIPVRKIQYKMPMTSEEIRLWDEADDYIISNPIFCHEFLSEWDEEKIYTMCKILKNKIGLKFVVFDYLKSNYSNAAENSNILGARTDFLKNKIAGELDLAVLSAVQLNREGEVADSDKIMRYCSTSIYWRRKTLPEIAKDGEGCGNCIGYVDINRNGPSMDADEAFSFVLDGSKMRISVAGNQPENTPFN